MRAAFFRAGFTVISCLAVLCAVPTRAAAEGWENIGLTDLISRSRYIGVGTLSIDGKSDDGWLKGKFSFTQQIYSGIGDTTEYPARIAPVTVPGKMQNWPSRKRGIWFILKSGDAFEPVNHPGCWMDESKANAVADAIYQGASKAYQEAKTAAKQQSPNGTSDSSDSQPSVAAYAAMVAAADAMRRVPYRDTAQQSRTFYEQVMSMLETAGIKPPIGGDLSNPAKQGEFFTQAKQLLGPAGAAMGELRTESDPARATQIAAAQKNVASVYLELVRNTLGSGNPAESIKKMGPIPVELPQGAEKPPAVGPPGFPPGPGPGRAPAIEAPGPKTAQFQLPTEVLDSMPGNGSRRQMLGAMLQGQTGPPQAPAPRGPGGPGAPRPGPGPR